MKAELSEMGVLTITPENSTEAYALNQWESNSRVNIRSFNLDEDYFWRGPKIFIKPIPVEE